MKPSNILVCAILCGLLAACSDKKAEESAAKNQLTAPMVPRGGVPDDSVKPMGTMARGGIADDSVKPVPPKRGGVPDDGVKPVPPRPVPLPH